jgi:hypothetical protein
VEIVNLIWEKLELLQAPRPTQWNPVEHANWITPWPTPYQWPQTHVGVESTNVNLAPHCTWTIRAVNLGRICKLSMERNWSFSCTLRPPAQCKPVEHADFVGWVLTHSVSEATAPCTWIQSASKVPKPLYPPQLLLLCPWSCFTLDTAAEPLAQPWDSPTAAACPGPRGLADYWLHTWLYLEGNHRLPHAQRRVGVNTSGEPQTQRLGVRDWRKCLLPWQSPAGIHPCPQKGRRTDFYFFILIFYGFLSLTQLYFSVVIILCSHTLLFLILSSHILLSFSHIFFLFPSHSSLLFTFEFFNV